MSARVTNPDGCASCFPCLATTDAGCDCPAECHDPGSYYEPDTEEPGPPNSAAKDRLSWSDDEITVTPDRFHLVIREPDGARLVESLEDFLLYAKQESRNPQELLEELINAGRMDDAPKSLLHDLATKDLPDAT